MSYITKADVWTELDDNTILTCGAVVDGFSNYRRPYDNIVVIKNCVSSFIPSKNVEKLFTFPHRHHVVLFKKNGRVTRVAFLNKDTDIKSQLEEACCQPIENNDRVGEMIERGEIKVEFRDARQSGKNKFNCDADIASCESEELLKSFQSGNVTADQIENGEKWQSVNYFPTARIKIFAHADGEIIDINHTGVIIGRVGDITRAILIQDESKLDEYDVKQALKHAKIDFKVVEDVEEFLSSSEDEYENE